MSMEKDAIQGDVPAAWLVARAKQFQALCLLQASSHQAQGPGSVQAVFLGQIQRPVMQPFPMREHTALPFVSPERLLNIVQGAAASHKKKT